MITLKMIKIKKKLKYKIYSLKQRIKVLIKKRRIKRKRKIRKNKVNQIKSKAMIKVKARIKVKQSKNK
jgi:hypothetical protein